MATVAVAATISVLGLLAPAAAQPPRPVSPAAAHPAGAHRFRHHADGPGGRRADLRRHAHPDVDLQRHVPGADDPPADGQDDAHRRSTTTSRRPPAASRSTTTATTRPRRTTASPTTFLVPPGGSRTYYYTGLEDGGNERGAMQWYHDHRDGVTGRNVWMGLAGLYIIDDPADPQTLPSGEHDVPLAISDRSFDANNQISYYIPVERRDRRPHPRQRRPAALPRRRPTASTASGS